MTKRPADVQELPNVGKPPPHLVSDRPWDQSGRGKEKHTQECLLYTEGLLSGPTHRPKASADSLLVRSTQIS